MISKQELITINKHAISIPVGGGMAKIFTFLVSLNLKRTSECAYNRGTTENSGPSEPR